MANCRSCGAEIVWAKTERGKAIPLDAKPEKRFVLEEVPMQRDRQARQVTTYVSHFATCPDADKFRSKR
jgi:hypothetical protein